ncbi:MAG TPA: glycosyltransferase family 39 protein [Polyangia bacterium]
MLRDRLGRAGALPGVLILAAAVGALIWLDQFNPFRHWLFLQYLAIWLAVALFAMASWAAGLRMVSLILPVPLRLDERLLVGFAVGVLIFFAGVFVGGVLHLYGRVFFFAWPALLLAWSGRSAWRELRRLRGHLGRFGFRLFQPRGAVEAAAAAVLVVGTLAVYLQVLTPTNVGADSVWYHLPIAEDYVATGGIRPFSEGFYNATLPQLATFLYTWAFMAPGDLFHRMALSAHLEFALFVATLAGIGVLVRRLIGARAPLAGALMFVFPGFLMFDSNLIVGADHLLAFWVPPLAVAVLRWARRFETREAVLVALLTGGAMLTRYQAIYLVVPLALWAVGASIRLRRWRPLVAWGLAVLVAWSPHWLKNWIFYGDPLYPMLRAWLPAHPFPPGAEALRAEVLTPPQFRLTGTPGQKVLDTLVVLFSFSFVPHDWDFHGARPVFGSLFTCLLVGLPFARARLRTWLLVIAIEVGIAVWFVTAHEDRYLQALLPAMVAVAAALAMLLWRRGALARVGVVLLVASQAIAGSDVYFYRVHGMAGDAPIKAFVDFVSLGQKGQYKDQMRVWGDLDKNDLSKYVPQGGKVLAHHLVEQLGLGVPSVTDGVGWQAAVDYLAQPTPADTLAVWRSLGITHVAWKDPVQPRDRDFLAREAVFQRATALYVPRSETVGQYPFGALDLRAPPAAAHVPTNIAWIGCGGDLETGVYTPRDYAEGHAPTVRGLSLAALATANVVLRHPSCGFPSPEVSGAIDAQFARRVQIGDILLLARRER